MSLNDASSNLFDFFKVVLKVLIICILAQLVLNLTDSGVHLPVITPLMNFIATTIQGAVYYKPSSV